MGKRSDKINLEFAEKVMGWKWINKFEGHEPILIPPETDRRYGYASTWEYGLPDFLPDYRQKGYFFEILERLEYLGYDYEISSHLDMPDNIKYTATISKNHKIISSLSDESIGEVLFNTALEATRRVHDD